MKVRWWWDTELNTSSGAIRLSDRTITMECVKFKIVDTATAMAVA
jgi:hypothetical protein